MGEAKGINVRVIPGKVAIPFIKNTITVVRL